MTTYAKLTPEGQLNVLRYIPHVACPSEARMAAYAAANGYKPVSQTPAPGKYYTLSWEESDTEIHNVWNPLELSSAKEDAMQRVQTALTLKLAERATVDCPGFPSGIVYDEDALHNAAGMTPGDPYIDAANNVTELTQESLDAVRAALKAYRMSLYLAATEKRVAIEAATNVDEVEAAIAEPIK